MLVSFESKSFDIRKNSSSECFENQLDPKSFAGRFDNRYQERKVVSLCKYPKCESMSICDH